MAAGAGFELYPAIDLRGGRCVRLYQGDYARETVYGDDPAGQARRFAAAGARWVHVVDLDAARSGDPVNRPVVAAIAAALPSGVGVQAGGGVRSVAAAEALFAAGVRRVVVGTAALEHPDLVAELAPRRRAHRLAAWRWGSTCAAGRWRCGAGSAAPASTWPRCCGASRRSASPPTW